MTPFGVAAASVVPRLRTGPSPKRGGGRKPRQMQQNLTDSDSAVAQSLSVIHRIVGCARSGEKAVGAWRKAESLAARTHLPKSENIVEIHGKTGSTCEINRQLRKRTKPQSLPDSALTIFHTNWVLYGSRARLSSERTGGRRAGGRVTQIYGAFYLLCSAHFLTSVGEGGERFRLSPSWPSVAEAREASAEHEPS